MRFITLILPIILALGCAGSKNVALKSGKLNGAWAPVQEEMGGTSLPGAAFEKQRLIISDSVYTFTAESVDKGIIKYKDDKMDIYGREGINQGKHFTAIYKLENGALTVCYNLSGDHYPETFETQGKPAFFLAVFRKRP